MKAITILVVLLVAMSVGGCKFLERATSMTPEEQYFSALRTYKATLVILNDLRAAGYIDDELKDKITPYLDMAEAALAGMRLALLSDDFDSPAFKKSLDDFFRALLKIDKLRELAWPEGETP